MEGRLAVPIGPISEVVHGLVGRPISEPLAAISEAFRPISEPFMAISGYYSRSLGPSRPRLG